MNTDKKDNRGLRGACAGTEDLAQEADSEGGWIGLWLSGRGWIHPRSSSPGGTRSLRTALTSLIAVTSRSDAFSRYESMESPG